MDTLLSIALLIPVLAVGAVSGSFLTEVIYRLPRKESFVSGRSCCPACKHELSALDLVPLLSYLFLGGKCRYCREPLSPRYLLVEALACASALVSYLAFLPPSGFLLDGSFALVLPGTAKELGLMALWLPFDLPASAGALIAATLVFILLCVLIAVTFIDADTMEIPNTLPIWVAALGLISIAFGPTAALPWYDHLIGACTVSVPLFMLAFFIAGSFGFGDVKLIAAAGFFLGWKLILPAAFMGIVIGGAYGIYLLAIRKKGRKEHFAFGPSLCIGIALSVFVGQPLIIWYLGIF